MNIIVAGGSGLIGQELTRDLVFRGHRVWVLTRNPQEAQLPKGVTAVGWDGKTAQGWGNLVNDADAIINLAGANIGARPWTNERKRLIRDSRVQAGQAVVAALRQSEPRPRVVILNGGIGYYGDQGDRPLDESGSPGSDFPASVAQDWEKANQPAAELGARLVLLRTGVVLSRQGGVLAPFVLQNRLFAGGPLGSGKQWISWIHMQDLVRLMNWVLGHEEANGIFNAVAPEPLTNAEFGRTVSRVMHRPFWIPAPAFALRAALGEMSTLVLEGQRVVPRRLEEMGFQWDFPTLRAALEDLLR